MNTIPTRSAIKPDLFASDAHQRKIEALGDPLQAIDRHIDFDHLAKHIDALLARVDANRGGRPPYPTVVMLRILVLKHLNNLSDEQMEFQLLDRISWQRFCRLSDSANVPNRNTIWNYQQRLGSTGTAALFQAIEQQLLRHGFIARCGQIIDATLVSAPIQHFTKQDQELLANGQVPADWSQAKRRQKDLDATHTKKRGQHHHGYKLSVSVDVKHKFIRKIATGTASVHDSKHFDAVLDKGNTGCAVYADRGYPSQERSAKLKALGYQDQIQRKAQRNQPLSQCQKQRNQRISKTRVRVEHVFAQIRHMGGKLLRTIGQARASAVMTMMAVCYNIKRLTTFLETGVDAFYKSIKPTKAKLRPKLASA